MNNRLDHVSLVAKLREISPRVGVRAIQTCYKTLSLGQATLIYFGDYTVLNEPDGSMGLILTSTLVSGSGHNDSHHQYSTVQG